MIPAWISNYMAIVQWDEITYPVPDFAVVTCHQATMSADKSSLNWDGHQTIYMYSQHEHKESDINTGSTYKWGPLLLIDWAAKEQKHNIHFTKMERVITNTWLITENKEKLTHKQLETHGCVLSAVATDVINHQDPQCWLNIHCTGLISYKNITVIGNYIRR